MKNKGHTRDRRDRLRAGFVTVVPLALAAVSALLLMSACHSTPPLAAGQEATGPPVSAATAIAVVDAQTAPLQAFDEHFYTPPVDDDDQ